MTTLPQQPYAAEPGTQHIAVQEPHAQQYTQVQQHGQQQVAHRQQAAPPVQRYPIYDQHYQPSAYARLPLQTHAEHQPPHPGAPANEQATWEPYTTRPRPTFEPRHSYSSHRSARSHKSTHSVDSHRSARSGRSHRSTHSHGSQRSHHSHQGADGEIKDRQRRRDLDSRPTMGDSVMLVVNSLRDMLSGGKRRC